MKLDMFKQLKRNPKPKPGVTEGPTVPIPNYKPQK